MTKKRRKVSGFDVLMYTLSALMLIIVAYPLILVLSNSVSDPGKVATGQIVFLPKGFNFDGYKAVFGNEDIRIGFMNTIFYTVVGTAVNLVMSINLCTIERRQTIIFWITNTWNLLSR